MPNANLQWQLNRQRLINAAEGAVKLAKALPDKLSEPLKMLGEPDCPALQATWEAAEAVAQQAQAARLALDAAASAALTVENLAFSQASFDYENWVSNCPQ